MLVKTKGIVLHNVRYGDHSLILTVYTEEYGRQSYIMNASRGPKSKNKAGILQPLYMVDLEVYQKKNREIQRIKELRIINPYSSIPFHIVKSSEVIFLSEILYRVLQEEEKNLELFQFLENSLLAFDILESGVSIFHIWFLLRLTGFLGIKPDLQNNENHWFDMQKGLMVAREPFHNYYMNPGTSNLLKQIFQMNIQELGKFEAALDERTILLRKILEYYHQHFNNLEHLRSFDVLKEVFH
ncbi:DNA replication and repair protein RecO [Bacteroidales bacterium 6E]|nr:DNA replication and repair protein RecO [Bacteroidales bacterium 6E]